MTAAVEAKAEGMVANAERVAPRVWAVPSSSAPGELHVVSAHRLPDGGWAWVCDCTAAEFNRRCSHVQAVALAAQREQAKGAKR